MTGTGKSTIARTMARELHGRRHLGADFFFSYGGGDVGHAEPFVTTIASQVVASEHLVVGCERALRASISKVVFSCLDIAPQVAARLVENPCHQSDLKVGRPFENFENCLSV
jgi:hypothetical protein